MIIEIKGTGSHNKGAEMMLLTILQELGKQDIKFAMAPIKGVNEYTFYSKLGIYPKAWLCIKGFQVGRFGKMIPKRIRDLYGLIADEEVDVIIDSSGFAYSSQWGEAPAKIMAQDTRRWKKMNKKIILMPQAFGPFQSSSIRSSMKQIIDNSDLIFARDEFSYSELLNLSNTKEKIWMAPDFTILLQGEVPSYFDPAKHQICIVPNQRMKDRKDETETILYEEFLAKIIEYVQKSTLIPFFLIQGGHEDLMLAEKVNSLLTKQIEILHEEDAHSVKGIISCSLALIGSRYHSLASALYAAIPTLGFGWSHKYKYLFDDFNYQEGIIELDLPDNELFKKINLITQDKSRNDIIKKLREGKKNYERRTKLMFAEIKSLLGIS
jgi:polysaccharide pyruvyl transferase WcaK-like protein